MPQPQYSFPSFLFSDTIPYVMGNQNSGRRHILTVVHREFIALLCANRYNIEATARAQGHNIATVRKWFEHQDFKEELARRQEILSAAANVTAAEVIGILASQLRADIADVLPDVEVVRKARARGVSHLIRDVEIKTITRRDGSVEETVKVKMVDSTKAAIQLARLMGLEARDDSLERARQAIRSIMDLKPCSAEEAISILAPHNPVVTRLRDEFAGTGLVIAMSQSETS